MDAPKVWMLVGTPVPVGSVIIVRDLVQVLAVCLGSTGATWCCPVLALMTIAASMAWNASVMAFLLLASVKPPCLLAG